ncbi:hypothetical protein Droror1_Dr00028230 [Drosera rotundifolia]
MLLEGRKEEEREVVGWGGVERERKTEREIRMRKTESGRERKTEERCGRNNALCFFLVGFHRRERQGELGFSGGVGSWSCGVIRRRQWCRGGGFNALGLWVARLAGCHWSC